MTPVHLPEVPAPSAWAMTDYQPEANTQFTMRVDAAEHYASVGLQVEPLYTAAQLRAYATDAVMADRARLPNAYAISMALHTVYMDHDDYKVTTTLLDDMAKAVAALLTQPEQNSER